MSCRLLVRALTLIAEALRALNESKSRDESFQATMMDTTNDRPDECAGEGEGVNEYSNSNVASKNVSDLGSGRELPCLWKREASVFSTASGGANERSSLARNQRATPRRHPCAS